MARLLLTLPIEASVLLNPCDMSPATAQISIQQRIKCASDGHVALIVGMKQALPDEGAKSAYRTPSVRQRSPACLRALWRRMRGVLCENGIMVRAMVKRKS